jgi:hypothetical protein
MNRYCEESRIFQGDEAILEIASLLLVARNDNVEVFGAFAMVETKSGTDYSLGLICSGKL